MTSIISIKPKHRQLARLYKGRIDKPRLFKRHRFIRVIDFKTLFRLWIDDTTTRRTRRNWVVMTGP